MQAGKLNRIAYFKRLEEKQGPSGGVVEEYVEYATRWVGFIGLRGSERVTAVGDDSVMAGTIFMRYDQTTRNIKIGDLIEVDGVDYYVASPAINEGMKNITITIAVSLFRS